MCGCASRTVSQTVLWSIDCKGYILTRFITVSISSQHRSFSRLLTFNLMWCKSAVIFNELCFFLSSLFFFFSFFLVNAQLFWWTGLVVTSIEWMNEYVNSFMCALVVPWTINRCVKLLYFFSELHYTNGEPVYFFLVIVVIYVIRNLSVTQKTDRLEWFNRYWGFYTVHMNCSWNLLQSGWSFFSVYVEEMWEKFRGVIALGAVGN